MSSRMTRAYSLVCDIHGDRESLFIPFGLGFDMPGACALLFAGNAVSEMSYFRRVYSAMLLILADWRGRRSCARGWTARSGVASVADRFHTSS